MMSKKINIILMICTGLVLINCLRFFNLPTSYDEHERQFKPKENINNPIRTIAKEAPNFDYKIITRKPLFDKTREAFHITKVSNEKLLTPPKATLPKVKPVPELPELIGILTINSENYAFFKSGETRDAFTVGQKVNQWEIIALSSNKVTLTYQETKKIVNMTWGEQISFPESASIPGYSNENESRLEQTNLNDRLSRKLHQ